ncbi:hypothetical protein GOP47_0027955, partial [Adiantum capillus-veneris]
TSFTLQSKRSDQEGYSLLMARTRLTQRHGINYLPKLNLPKLECKDAGRQYVVNANLAGRLLQKIRAKQRIPWVCKGVRLIFMFLHVVSISNALLSKCLCM